MADRYDPREIENRWQARWEDDGLYRAADDDPRPKWYFLTMFPYTSGDLHVGHWYAMAPSDVGVRYRRMRGYNVMYPIGFDSFGLPAENAAIERGIHPKTWTLNNVERMRGQLKTMGSAFDWSREVITCLPEYYKWNQQIFLKMFDKGLAYRAKGAANWCPHCQTTLANEQITSEGTCERCKTLVTKRDLEQWFLRIKDYADELLDHSGLEWPEHVIAMQKNWIGKSAGVEVSFPLERKDLEEKEIRVFTTRPDTIYGVTFMVLAPEHPLVEKLTTRQREEEVQAYVERTRRLSEIERQSTETEKTGVFTGAYCINRVSRKRVPIYIADYALMHYGTGAVMAVPAHDTRDFAFARKYDIPIVTVIAPPGWKDEGLEEAYTEPGVMVNSAQFDGLLSDKGKEAIADYYEQQGWGHRTYNYRIRDWLISRQRYWGTPIPIIYCPKCSIVPVPEKDLPIVLPDDVEFRPTGESPLKFHQGFLNTACPKCGIAATREVDTMDTFVDSSWYQVRYASPHYDVGPADPKAVAKWLPVDQYTGGAEHATMHLLYARFFVKAMRDLGLVEHSEPFIRLFNQGQILGPDGQRMSKSRGNVVAPDEQVEQHGADTFRCYLMFLGPWDQGGPFDVTGISGISRWMNRVWRLVLDNYDATAAKSNPDIEQSIRKATHKTIKRATEDIERFRFNTLLAALMEFTNELSRTNAIEVVGTGAWREALDSLMLLLAPLAPHITEELWARTGHGYSIHNQSWPEWDESLTVEDEITLVVQVNGKVRDKLSVSASITEDRAKEIALASDKVKGALDGRQVAQVIYVPGRLVNVVIR
ncbi:MAG: leucine--tRNA ligase [Dehalococcoidia bacterium]|nr:leucine--tRNA ligase [Dehalococcoidia bacterium]